MGHHQLDELDYKILKLVASNARIPFLEVARECNVSGAAIHQRVQKLTNLGILKGSEYIIDSNKIGFETCENSERECEVFSAYSSQSSKVSLSKLIPIFFAIITSVSCGITFWCTLQRAIFPHFY